MDALRRRLVRGKSLVTVVLLVLAATIICKQVVWPTFVQPSPNLSSLGNDFAAYFIGSWEVTRGNSPYEGVGITNRAKYRLTDASRVVLEVPSESIPGYIYPPLLALAMQPLVPLGFRSALTAWCVGNCLLVLVCLGLCAYLFLPMGDRLLGTAILSVVVLASMPTRETLLLGQVNFLTLALSLSALLAFERKLLYLAGILLAAAAWIKLTPAFLLLFFLVHKRSWSVLGGFLIASVGFALWIVASIGFGEVVRYATEILPAAAESLLSLRNKAFLAMFDRLFRPNPLVEPLLNLPWLGSVVRVTLVAVLFGFANRLRQREAGGVRRDSRQSDRLLYAATLVLMLLCQPLLEIHHLIFVFPALACVIGVILRRRSLALGLAAIVAAALLNSRGHDAFADFGTRWWAVFLMAPQAWGLVLLGGLLYALGSTPAGVLEPGDQAVSSKP